MEALSSLDVVIGCEPRYLQGRLNASGMPYVWIGTAHGVFSHVAAGPWPPYVGRELQEARVGGAAWGEGHVVGLCLVWWLMTDTRPGVKPQSQEAGPRRSPAAARAAPHPTG